MAGTRKLGKPTDQRLAMLKYGINDIRTFYQTDLRESQTFDRKDA